MRSAPLCLAGLVGLWMAPEARPQRTADAVVAIHVAIEHEDGTPAAGLAAEEIEVLLDGEPQPVVRVSPGPRPLSVALLIDVTTRPRLPRDAMRAAVEQFVKALDGQDRARIWRVGGGITAGPPFTSDARALLGAARPAIDPRAEEMSGPSPIWDAVVEVVTALHGEAGRRAIVLITDGHATGNRHGLAEAVERASAADVSVNIVAPQGIATFWSESRVVKVHPEWMPQALAANTGGLFVHYGDGKHLPAGEMMRRIIAGLRHEYDVTIRRPAGKAQRLIEVRVKRQGLTMRARRIL